jgi:peptidyl-prolyl cis-trans isomerase SurA
MLQKYVVPSLAILAMAASAQTPAPATAAPAVKVVEEIAAKVNGEIITRGQLEEKHKEIEAAAMQGGLKGDKLTEAVKAADADALREEIDTLLLVQKGKEMPGVNVDADVTKFFQGMQTQYKFSDADKFHDFLQKQFGQSYDELKERKKRDFLAQKVVGYQVASRISVPEADLQKYYEEHKSEYVREEQVFLSQILISTEGKSAEQKTAAETKAKDLVARARKGEKFSELARDNSDDPETAQNGGYIGAPSKRGTLRPELEAIVFKEKKGYITDPIKLASPSGFLILKVEEHYEAGQASFEEVREDVQNAVVTPRMEPKVREFLTRLRQEAFLQIKDGYVDSGAAPGKDTRWQEVAQLKPALTTKEEVMSRAKGRKKVLGVSIPGTTAAAKTLEETEKPRKASKHRARPVDVAPEALESSPGPKAPKQQDSGPPMPPIKQ